MKKLWAGMLLVAASALPTTALWAADVAPGETPPAALAPPPPAQGPSPAAPTALVPPAPALPAPAPVTPSAVSPPPAAPTEAIDNPTPRTYPQSLDVQPNPSPYGEPPPNDEPYYYRRRHRRSGWGGPPVQTTTTWLNFRFAGVGVYQSGTSVYSPMFSWNPQISLKNGQYLGFNLGGMELTNSLSQNTLALEYEALVGFPFGSGSLVGIEFGVGAQTWFNQGETDPLLSANLFYRIPGFVIERVFLGYSGYLMPYFYTSEVKFGLGFSF